jgi:hypothetical protein
MANVDPNAQAGPAPPAPPTGPPAPTAAPAAARIAIRIQVPDLRNGDVANITQAAPRASIPARYKWAVIRGMPAAHAVTHVDAIIRATYAQYLGGNGGQVTDAVRTEARSAAIVIGSVRAVAAQAWALAPPDMNVEETAGTGSVFTAAPNGGMGTVAQDQGTAGGNFTVATGMAPITDAEVDVINLLLYMGAAIPVMQGISLVLTGHHFLPTTKNHFMGMKKQAVQMSADPVKQWIETLGDTFDDWAFHKACHPISPPVKRRWAKSKAVAARLVASGHTSVAIRVPALPSDAQGCKAAIAILMKAAPVIQAMGHTISWDNGTARINEVENSEEGRAELDAVARARSWLAANHANVGFCAGIVQHLSESLGNTMETTLRAFSVRRIMADQAAAVNRGATYCRAHLARLREQAMSGEFPDPMIMA